MNARHLKKLMLLGAAVLWFSLPAIPAGAEVNVQIQLPPLIVFSSPPEMVVLPDTYVYVVPDTEEEIFFFDGWWYRQWQERWYRSYYYDRGWIHYKAVPSFYVHVPPGWRKAYHERHWQGYVWDCHRLPFVQVQKNWAWWKRDKHWEKEQGWGVRDWKSGNPPAQAKAAQPQSHAQENQDQWNAGKHGKGHGKK
jgi:hypothetical protein